MGEKELKVYNFFRALLGSRSFFWTLLSRKNSPNSSSIFSVKSKGFTLIEMVVVIGMIAILATVIASFINPGRQIQNTRDAKRKSDLKTIQSALELFRADVGTYPVGYSSDNGIPSVANCPSTSSLTDDDSGTCTSPQTYYLQTVPSDPESGFDYYYLAGTPTGGYTLYSCLENTNDTDKLSTTTNPALPLSDSDVVNTLNCTAYYGVTNP